MYNLYKYCFPMTTTISLSEARRRLSELTDDVKLKGDQFLILKNGKEVARLVPPGEPAKSSQEISPEFYARLKDFNDRFSYDLELLSGS